MISVNKTPNDVFLTLKAINYKDYDLKTNVFVLYIVEGAFKK